ncbi:hypothetical protein AB0E27_42840 [Streptomyces sparsogenes]|uniref:hypothetical protein n=1 Tax=Streptomyces sparsogenes TaxID=67365 RepID=UPI0033FC0A6F
MSIVAERIAVPQAGESKPPLPQRPIPHESGGRRPEPQEGRPHPQLVGPVFIAEVLAAIEAMAAGVLPVCQQCCGREMTPEGGGRQVCEKCGGTWDGGGTGAVESLPAEAAEIGGGFCGSCGQPVSTLDGHYTCNSCGHNG